EAFDDQILKNMNKALTTKQVIDGIEATLAEGISPGFNIIFGNLGDNRKTLRKSIELLDKYNDFGQLRVIRPVTPYPGTPLYYHAIEEGLLSGPDDFYEKHKNIELLTCNFTDIPDDEFHELLFETNKKIIKDYYKHLEKTTVETFRNAYFGHDYSFRGARH
ncbi:MAG: B12-binding domain-containing radical SAM protein, partial [Bacteroidota bacterium]|nr:B12-binding domain-containing radical SAM protein [Bacteroidota bacterium]